MTDSNPHGRFEWHRRRRIIHYTLLYCLVVAVALVCAGLFGKNSTLLNTLVVSTYSLAGAVIGSYVFGAIWDDRNTRVYGDSYSGDDELPPPEPPPDDVPPAGNPG